MGQVVEINIISGWIFEQMNYSPNDKNRKDYESLTHCGVSPAPTDLSCTHSLSESMILAKRTVAVRSALKS